MLNDVAIAHALIFRNRDEGASKTYDRGKLCIVSEGEAETYRNTRVSIDKNSSSVLARHCLTGSCDFAPFD
jgi:hypothetical protein